MGCNQIFPWPTRTIAFQRFLWAYTGNLLRTLGSLGSPWLLPEPAVGDTPAVHQSRVCLTVERPLHECLGLEN